MKILCNDQRVELPAESTVLDCLRAAGAEGAVLAAMRGGQVLALNEPLRDSCTLTPITMDDEEGRRIYERSLRMIMLLAARRLFPGEQVRIEYSAGQGVFVRLPGLTLSPELVAQLEAEMQRIAAADLPFQRSRWAVADAVAYFKREGQQDSICAALSRAGLRAADAGQGQSKPCGGLCGSTQASGGVRSVDGLV